MVNKYTMTFPYSEEELYDSYVNKFMSQAEIGKMFGVSQRKVMSDMKRMGIQARIPYKRHQQGEQNTNWKGGRILVNFKTPAGHRFLSDRNIDKGYWMVKLPGHPNSGKNGYVFEHIVIALQSAGREKFEPNECVHHIDFNRKNNEPKNLLICTKDKHREYHGKLESLTGELFDKGIVGFDSELGYFVK